MTKVVLPNNNNYNHNKSKNALLLPLVPEEPVTKDKHNSTQMELATNPADWDASPKYKKYVTTLKGGETVRQVIDWYKDVKEVLYGMGLDEGLPQHQMVKTMLANSPLNLYQVELVKKQMARRQEAADAAQAGAPAQAIMAQELSRHTEPEDVKAALEHMMTEIHPRQVHARVKRYLRRECRKPADMSVKKYVQHLDRLNDTELELLPPFGANQKLNQDELLDIILFGTPKSWQREMDRQGKDPHLMTVAEVVEFMEQIEAAEDFDANKTTPKDKSKDKSKGKGNPKKDGSSGGKRDAYCLIHGQCSHTSDQCTVLQTRTH